VYHCVKSNYIVCVRVVQLIVFKQKYQKIPEVEQLRREIGSYQTKWSDSVQNMKCYANGAACKIICTVWF